MADNPTSSRIRYLIRNLYLNIRLQQMDAPDLRSDAYYCAWLVIMGLHETVEIYDER